MKFIKCNLEIDLSKITENYLTLRNICNGKNIGAAVKAEGYGLGANMVSKALEKGGCRHFFVANIEEGISLRPHLKNESNIFVLYGPLSKEESRVMAEYGLIPVINNLWQIKILQEFAEELQQRLLCIIHLNTGMHRLGMLETEIQQLCADPALLASIAPLYIMSHLSAAEIQDEAYNKQQLGLFKKYKTYFPTSKLSFANSSGIFLSPDYHFDLPRSGAALYGINPTPYKVNPMQNPVRLTAPIIHIQNLPEGARIGYNMSSGVERASVIATLPLGYADGYLRALSNCGVVYIDGIEARVVGRVSMDLITVDVTNIPGEKIFIGKEVEIMGDNCTPDKIASISNTIGYEILTNLGPRYKKSYKNAQVN